MRDDYRYDYKHKNRLAIFGLCMTVAFLGLAFYAIFIHP
jgi:hypothetical protein